MSDSFTPLGPGTDTLTETTSQTYFQRLAGSFFAAAIGILMLLGAIGLLVWNESRAVDVLRGLSQAAKEVSEAAPSLIDGAKDGKLVHLTGTLETKTPLSDPAMNLTKDGLVHLKRTVEMYQWKETSQSSSSNHVGGSESTDTTYSYTKKWSEEPIGSDDFKSRSRHENPPMPIKTRIVTARDATLGPRTLTPALLDDLDAYEPLPPPALAPDGYRRIGETLYKGFDPDMPEIGDLRVTFAAVPVQQVSVMAEQRGVSLMPDRTRSGYTLGLVAPGDRSAEEMVAETRSKEKTLTWILRAVGFALTLFALILISRPLSSLANVIPFVASLIGAGTFVFAVALAIPLTLITIGLAWIVVRPLFGLGLIAVAGACLYGFRRWRSGQAAPVAAGGLPA